MNTNFKSKNISSEKVNGFFDFINLFFFKNSLMKNIEKSFVNGNVNVCYWKNFFI